jgi:hypothetical protein
MKWKVSLFLLTLFGWYVATLAVPFTKASLSNAAFLIGLCLLLIASIAIIFKTGFLTPVTEGFRIIGDRMIRKSRAMERADKQIKNDYTIQSFKTNLAAFIMQSTFIVGAGSILISVVIIVM